MMIKWIAKKEKLGGDWYWMIYKRVLFFDIFYERWNTEESCVTRLVELRNPVSVELDI